MNSHAKELHKERFSLNGSFYSVTSTTHKRVPIFSDFYLARELVLSLKKSDGEQATDTIGFVVMPDHFHWLIQLGDKYSLSEAVGRVKGRAALAVNKQRNGIHKIWQAGFYDRRIKQEKETIHVMRYIVTNPLKAGLVRSLKHYPHWDCIYI